MADGGSPALKPPPLVPVAPPTPPVHLPAPPAQKNWPAQPPLNWSYFKPEFSAKPEDGAEWMETHNVTEVVKVEICLTLMGEVRLWYESLRHIAVCGLARPAKSV